MATPSGGAKRGSGTLAPRLFGRLRASEGGARRLVFLSPEDMSPLGELLLKHGLNGGPHLAHLALQLVVVVVGSARETHRLAEDQMVLGRQGERQQQRREGEGRQPE